MKFLNDAFDRFAEKAPISVMVRALIENALSPERLDAIFDENAKQQYSGDLMFSTVADIMGQVVCQIHPSVNAAYLDRKEEIGVTVKSVYDKLKGIETPVSRALVHDTAMRLQAIIKQTGGINKPLLAGYRTKIVDGNHLRHTDRRIGEFGNVRVYRRITVKLNEPTRDGDAEVHIVTNLPKRVGAIHIADLYRDRWKIETAFQEVAKSLEGEIQAMGYPKAALFGFCMALVTYNFLSVVRAAVHAVHGEEAANNLSTYYVSLEVSSTHFGMSVILEGEFWRKKYGQLTPRKMAEELKRLARNIRLSKFKKGKWTRKKKTKKKMNKKNRGHKSTLRILEESRTRTAKAA